MERSVTQYQTITDREPARDRSRGSSAGHTPATRPKRRRWGRGASSLLLVLLALPALAGVVKIERISPPPLDLEVALPSASPSISADGRFVAFISGGRDILVRDQHTGAQQLVSVGAGGDAANDWSASPAISGDGRFVSFVSSATNLAPGHTDGSRSLYVRDREAGRTEWIADGEVPSLNADGRFVAFVRGGIQVWDRQTGKTERVAEGWAPAINADGRFVTFESNAGALTPGDTNGEPDVFLRDRRSGTTELVSIGARGEAANGWSGSATISADGRFVAFVSRATNLVAEPARSGVFVRDRETGRTEWIADGDSAAISADGRFVAFSSWLDNLVSTDTNGTSDVFVQDRQTGRIERATVATNGASPYELGRSPTISADGRFVGFTVGPQNAEHAVVRDRVAATTETLTVSVNVARTPVDSGSPAISADGQWVLFVTAGQVFERNRTTGATALISATVTGAPANDCCHSPAISADGRVVAFVSPASNLTPGDTNDHSDVFVWDRQTRKMERLEGGYPPTISGDGRFVAWGYSVWDRQTRKLEEMELGSHPKISADGRYIAFHAYPFDMVPGYTSNMVDLLLRDRQTGKVELVSVTPDGAPANGDSRHASISADGRFVAFQSEANNLVAGDVNELTDTFVRDRLLRTTERVGAGGYPAISADGRFIAFVGDGVQVWDRQTGKTERVADGRSPAISADGRFVTFESNADNLAPGDMNGRWDVFVAERQ
jgi:Tol biopolymer transport system component